MRPLSWLVIVALCGWLGLGWLKQTAGSVQSASSPQREVHFTYVARISQLSQDGEQVHVWIPLAKTGSEQTILRRDVRSQVSYTIAEDPEYGNDVLHLNLVPPFPNELKVSVDYHVRLRGEEGAAVAPPPASDELMRYLKPRGLVIVDKEVRARAKRATAGRATLMERARGIYEAVIQQVVYDKSVPGWGQGDTRRVCLLGKGNCTDFHSLFISMARSERIPARFKIGVVIPPESTGIVRGYHCWAEFYADGHGWVPVDASEAWKHPDLSDYYFGARDGNRLLMSRGRDIRLVPPQQGGPVNIFFYPYIEVDGQVSGRVETEMSFQALNQEGSA